MQTQHAGLIKGLGITALVLSALTLLLCLFCVVILGITGATLESSGLLDSLAYEMAHSSYYGMNYYDYGIDSGSFVDIMGLMVAVAGVVIGWEVITCVVSLIAGIMALRHANNLAKYGSIFVWSLVGAGASLLGGRLITMAVLIVVAVFANKDKNAAQTAYWQQSNPAYAQAGYAQTAGAAVGTQGSATVQTATAGTQNTAAQAPVQPAECVQPQQPMSPINPQPQGVAVPQTPRSAGAAAQVPAQAAQAPTYPQPTAAYRQAYGEPVQAAYVQTPQTSQLAQTPQTDQITQTVQTEPQVQATASQDVLPMQDAPSEAAQGLPNEKQAQ